MLGPDQAQCFVGPDLGPNCLQRLSADNTSRQSKTITYMQQTPPLVLQFCFEAYQKQEKQYFMVITFVIMIYPLVSIFCIKTCAKTYLKDIHVDKMAW